MICDARLKNKDNIIDVEDYKFVNEFQKNNGYNIHLFPIAINKYGSPKGQLFQCVGHSALGCQTLNFELKTFVKL